MRVIVARYLVKEGHEAEVVALLQQVAAYSNSDAEPGCVLYTVNQSSDDPRRLLLYEQYRDQAALEAHSQTELFQNVLLGQVVPLLESREREYFDVVAGP